MRQVVAVIAVLMLVFVSTASAKNSGTYLHQGEASVFQTAASFDLQDQGAVGLVKVRPGDRLASNKIRFTITGHQPFVYGKHTIQRDCRWTVTVTKTRESNTYKNGKTIQHYLTSSSGAQGVCVEAPGQ